MGFSKNAGMATGQDAISASIEYGKRVHCVATGVFPGAPQQLWGILALPESRDLFKVADRVTLSDEHGVVEEVVSFVAQARVLFWKPVMRTRVQQTVDFAAAPQLGRVRFRLLDSSMLAALEGEWRLEALEPGRRATRITYSFSCWPKGVPRALRVLPGVMDAVKAAVCREARQLFDKLRYVASKVGPGVDVRAAVLATAAEVTAAGGTFKLLQATQQQAAQLACRAHALADLSADAECCEGDACAGAAAVAAATQTQRQQQQQQRAESSAGSEAALGRRSSSSSADSSSSNSSSAGSSLGSGSGRSGGGDGSCDSEADSCASLLSCLALADGPAGSSSGGSSGPAHSSSNSETFESLDGLAALEPGSESGDDAEVTVASGTPAGAKLAAPAAPGAAGPAAATAATAAGAGAAAVCAA